MEETERLKHNEIETRTEWMIEKEKETHRGQGIKDKAGGIDVFFFQQCVFNSY